MWKQVAWRIRRVVVRALVLVVVATGMTPLRGVDDFVEEPPPQPAPAFPQPVPVPLPVMPQLRLDVLPQFGVFQPPDEERRPKAPSLGIAAGPLPPAVRAQVDLPDGVGLLVESVAEDGPAGDAGVLRFDLLVKFDDQLVCSPQQLDTLVRMAGVGAKASLTIRRGGRERVLEATIEERSDDPRPVHVVPGGPWQPVPPAGAIPGGPPAVDGLAEEIRRRVEEAVRAAQPGFAVPPDGFMPPPPAPVPPPMPRRSQGMAMVSDGDGTIELREQDGARTVRIRDREGVELHAGPLDTDADREAVPEKFRDKVRAIEGRLGRGGRQWAEPPAARPPQAPPPLEPAPEPEPRTSAPRDSTPI